MGRSPIRSAWAEISSRLSPDRQAGTWEGDLLRPSNGFALQLTSRMAFATATPIATTRKDDRTDHTDFRYRSSACRNHLVIDGADRPPIRGT
jgi:hypothetical protein